MQLRVTRCLVQRLEDLMSGLLEGIGFKSAVRVERLEGALTLGDSLA